MNVLLVQPPEELNKLMGRGKYFVPPVPPTGLMYLAAYLQRHGHAASILDAFFHDYDVRQTATAILAAKPDLVGLSCLTANGPSVYALVKILKESAPDLPVTLGNVHASVFSSFFLRKAGADFVVHGDGEETLLELVEALQNGGGDFAGINGLSFMADGRVVDTPRNRKYAALDEYPWPARDLIPLPQYCRDSRGRQSDMIFSSRGCVNRCTFCSVSQHQHYRYRDPHDVVDELAHIKKNYKITNLTFGDPLFTAKKKRVIEICQQILSRNLVTPFFAEGHARFVDPEILEALKAAGCQELAFGIETGSPRIMRQILKNTDHEQVAKAVDQTRRAGINATGLFMLGFPGETEDEIRRTIKLATELPLGRAQFAIVTPYPGTPIYNDLLASGQIKPPDEDDPAFVTDWYRYSAYISYTKLDSIWSPAGLGSATLKKYQKQAVRKFYLRPRQIWRELKKHDFRDWGRTLEFVKAAKDSIF